MRKTADHTNDIDAQAADWFTRLHSGAATEEMRRRFEVWLHADQAHKSAYQVFEQVYRDLDFVAPEAGVDVDHFLGRKKTRITRLRVPGLSPHRAGMAVSGAVAVMVLALLTPTLFTPGDSPVPAGLNPQDAAIISTDIGEIREIRLEDGSKVTLGGRSQLQAFFTETSRKVVLLDGEAFFAVAQDPQRPFFVSGQDTLIRVVGTEFNVKHGADIVHVDVLEGVVEVMKPSDLLAGGEGREHRTASKQVLTAGERVSVARRMPLPQARQAEAAEPGAWRTGRFVYENASLAEIIADLNRYSERPVVLASPEVGELRSTIAFDLGEIDRLFEVIAAIHPVDIRDAGTGEIIIRGVY